MVPITLAIEVPTTQVYYKINGDCHSGKIGKKKKTNKTVLRSGHFFEQEQEPTLNVCAQKHKLKIIFYLYNLTFTWSIPDNIDLYLFMVDNYNHCLYTACLDFHLHCLLYLCMSTFAMLLTFVWAHQHSTSPWTSSCFSWRNDSKLKTTSSSKCKDLSSTI